MSDHSRKVIGTGVVIAHGATTGCLSLALWYHSVPLIVVLAGVFVGLTLHVLWRAS